MVYPRQEQCWDCDSGLSNELYHHGVKGQKWGVRRYQNKDGTRTALAKARRDMDDVNDIASTLSKEDRRRLDLGDSEKWQNSIEDGKALAYRYIKRVGGTPVAVFDLYKDETTNGLAPAVMTRAGDAYRGKGYGTAVAKKGKQWLDKHADEYGEISWWALKENTASRKIAESTGWEYDNSSESKDDPWVRYEYTKGR